MTESERPPTGPDVDPEPSFWQYVEQRGERFERDIHRLRLQVLYLFAFLIVALVVASIRAQLNDNRIELDRYLRCQERIVAVNTYNLALPAGIVAFPIPDCGVDPRTD